MKVPHPVRPVASALALLFCFSTSAAAASAPDVTIDGGQVQHDVYGNGDTRNDGNLPTAGDFSSLGGANFKHVLIQNNAVVEANGMGVAGGAVLKNVPSSSGGTTTENSAINNFVEVKNGAKVSCLSNSSCTTATAGVVGGAVIDFAASGSVDSFAEGNKVNIGTATVNLSVIGGMVLLKNAKATATGNEVNLSDSADIRERVIGGMAAGVEADVAGNKVTMGNTATVSGDVYGGLAAPTPDSAPIVVSVAKARAENNEVTITGSGHVVGAVQGVDGNVLGGDAAGSSEGVANNNRVTIDSRAATAVTRDVFGGRAKGTLAEAGGNRATITRSNIGGTVVGSYAESDASAIAMGSTVEINGGEITGEAVGGYATVTAGGVTAEAKENFVTMKSGYVAMVVGGKGSVGNIGSPATIKATNNTVTIHQSSTIRGMSLSPGKFAVIGGYAFTHGVAGATGPGEASGNTVNIEGGTINGNVAGGFVDNAYGTAKAMGNTVDISGASTNIIQGGVFGGLVLTRGNATVTGNTVIISDIQGIDGNLYGGWNLDTGTGDFFTGNTLYLHSKLKVTGDLGNFQFLNFHLPATVKSGDTVLEVGTADLTGSKVGVILDGAGSPFAEGEKVTLIEAGTTLIASPDNITVTQGPIQYEVALDTESDTFVATFVSRDNSLAKSWSEGYLASTAFLVQGSDFLTSRGLQAAQSALAGKPSGVEGFVAVGGGKLRHETGSHVDVDGYNLIAGVTSGFSTGMGNASLSAFFEYGDGDYTSTNSFASGKVKGKGDTGYKGLGLMGRLELGNATYLEGSLRGGKTDVDYRTDSANLGRYDAKSSYIGAHLGAGEVWKLSEANSVDGYLQFLWTHQGKESTTPSGNGNMKLEFDVVDSKRIKIGVRAKHAFTPGFFGYAGLSYDHETSARARATQKYSNGQSLKIETPDLKGGTGTVEFGFSGKPVASQPLYLDLGVQAHGGKRDGVTASFRASYLF